MAQRQQIIDLIPAHEYSRAMTASQQARAAGLKSLAQLSRLIKVNRSTLYIWHSNKPDLFEVVLIGAVQKVREDLPAKPICVSGSEVVRLIDVLIEEMIMLVVRSEDEINKVLNEAFDTEDTGSKFPGMSFEQGIRAMYDWLVGNDESPMDD